VTDSRAAWIGTCVFWTWCWVIGSIVWAPFTFGLSLLGLIPAGLSAWSVVIPIGKPAMPAYPQLPHGQYGAPPMMPRQY
jgi:hypothetical protein